MILAALAAASVAAFSCTRFEEGPEFEGGLTLVLDGGALQTRANATSYESTVDHFDFFFFADEAGETPLNGMHARVTGASTTLDTRTGATYAPLRSRTSYVYILANYGEALDHTQNWTLEDLLALDVTSKILEEKKTAENPISHELEETGEVVLNPLVMDSYNLSDETYTVKVTPTEVNQEKTITVPLTRLAAKHTLDMTIEASVPCSMAISLQ